MYIVVETNEDNKFVEHIALNKFETLEEARDFLDTYVSRLIATGDINLLQYDNEEGFANYYNLVSDTTIKVEIMEEDDFIG